MNEKTEYCYLGKESSIELNKDQNSNAEISDPK